MTEHNPLDCVIADLVVSRAYLQEWQDILAACTEIYCLLKPVGFRLVSFYYGFEVISRFLDLNDGRNRAISSSVLMFLDSIGYRLGRSASQGVQGAV